jgi:hypothetical protein
MESSVSDMGVSRLISRHHRTIRRWFRLHDKKPNQFVCYMWQDISIHPSDIHRQATFYEMSISVNKWHIPSVIYYGLVSPFLYFRWTRYTFLWVTPWPLFDRNSHNLSYCWPQQQQDDMYVNNLTMFQLQDIWPAKWIHIWFRPWTTSSLKIDICIRHKW